MMIYVGVEFVDHYNDRSREFIAFVPYDETESDVIAYDGALMQEFDDWVEDGVNPDWTDEEKEEYYESCEWFWWFLDEDEVEEIKNKE